MTPRELTILKITLEDYIEKGQPDPLDKPSKAFNHLLSSAAIKKMEERVAELNALRLHFWKEAKTENNRSATYWYEEDKAHAKQDLERWQTVMVEFPHQLYLRAYMTALRAFHRWSEMPKTERQAYTWPGEPLNIKRMPETAEELIERLPYFDKARWSKDHDWDRCRQPAKTAAIEALEELIAAGERELAQQQAPAPTLEPPPQRVVVEPAKPRMRPARSKRRDKEEEQRRRAEAAAREYEEEYRAWREQQDRDLEASERSLAEATERSRQAEEELERTRQKFRRLCDDLNAQSGKRFALRKLEEEHKQAVAELDALTVDAPPVERSRVAYRKAALNYQLHKGGDAALFSEAQRELMQAQSDMLALEEAERQTS
ncbi:hypothetical protein [Roseomonas harenae]|uniref:hypothetical protein n=1 Tax=Muricoccus harenae TaxID=2692566 RepID=UPI001331AA27|nr:hypothetical protein [Roseomonas harenae]